MNRRLAAVLAAPALDGTARSHLRLVRADVTDAAFVAALRNDPALNRHLNAPASDVADQLRWLEGYKAREAAGEEFYFVIVCDGADKGVVRLYDMRAIDGRASFSWGSWIIAPPPVDGLATYTATLLYELGFDALGFDQAHFDVRRTNDRVVGFHLRAGAEVGGGTEDDLFFRFPRSAWPAFRAASARQIALHRGGEPG